MLQEWLKTQLKTFYSIASRKTLVCGQSLAGIAGSDSTGGCGVDVLSLVNVVCCQVEVFAMGRSVVQRSPTMCVCVCVSLSVSRCNNNYLHLQRLSRKRSE